jgi:hypothetical protein
LRCFGGPFPLFWWSSAWEITLPIKKWTVY